ncbi:DUF202 domain-containing protein [Maridesulfovibrio sp.]|uniref:YidH family protein n=1 Tax=Maridesulfovibrio sp. TaxID=2795000 RepID=UPI002A18A59C|nr:DUF202 domain-containing protein [Maridesulfovibrio sp.]
MAKNNEVHDQLDNNDLARMRTLLANERTFLAWCRTSLGLIGFGFLIEKAGIYMRKFVPETPQDVLNEMTFLSIFTLVSGVVILISAAVRFIRFERSVGARIKWTTPYPEMLVTIAVGLILLISTLAGKMFFK